MLYKISAMLFAILFLSACTIQDDGPGGLFDAPDSMELVNIFYTGSQAKNASSTFVENLEQAGLDVTVESVNGLESVMSGFYFADGMEIKEYSPLIKELSRDFLFVDYNHFTMSMNSVTVLSACEKELKNADLVPVAVFYCGSDYILSSTNIDDFNSFAGDQIDGILNYDEELSPVLLMNNSVKERKAAYTQAGSNVRQNVGAEARLSAITDIERTTDFIAEYSDDESIIIANIQLEDIFYVRPMFNVKTVWLLADKSYYSGLSADSRTAIHECLAKTFPEIDGKAVEAEKHTEAIMTDQRALRSRDFTRSRQLLYRLEHNPASELGYEVKKIIEYINTISNQ